MIAISVLIASLALVSPAMALPHRGGWKWRSQDGTVTSTVSDAVEAVETASQPAASQPAVTTFISSGGGGGGSGESHVVTLVNNCGSGTPVFITRDISTPTGAQTISGPLYGGVAWLENYSGGQCQMSGVGCGTVEFTLINPGTDAANTQNSINYSLQSQGDHNFVYPMDFAYTGGCTNGAPGQCASEANCPGAFVGTDTASGTPVQCVGSNAGITITFC